MTNNDAPRNNSETRNNTIGDILLEFIEVILRRRRFVIRFVLAATVLTTTVALFLPKWYMATVSVFPAEKTDIMGSLEGVSSLMKSFSGGKGLSALGGQTESMRFVAILKSERMLLSVIEKFNLRQVYDITAYPREKTMKELMSNLDVEIAEEGNLTISVFDKDPVRSAGMANYFVEQLNLINAEINARNSSAYRVFIEQRYQTCLVSIAAAEEAMKTFQQTHGVLAVPEQMEAAIKTSAELYGMVALREVEAGVLDRSVSADNPLLIEKRNEIAEMKKKLDEMRRGTPGDSSEMKLFLPLNKTPELGTKYIRLLRELKVQAKIIEFITPLYEQAKMEEKRNTPTVMVLDAALVPERKAKPKVAMFALMALVISTLAAVGIVFVREFVTRLESISSDRLRRLWETSRSDWFGLRSPKNK